MRMASTARSSAARRWTPTSSARSFARSHDRSASAALPPGRAVRSRWVGPGARLSSERGDPREHAAFACPRSALELLPRVPCRIATVHGRYYAMDRDKRWDRIERSYRAIVDADGPRVDRAEDAVRECYARPACRDELLEPHVVGEGEPIRDRDAVIFFNFRPDRARQLTWALMRPDFEGFARRRLPRDLTFVTL